MAEAYDISIRLKKALYLTPSQRAKSELQQAIQLKKNKDCIFDILYKRMFAMGLTNNHTFDEIYKSFCSISHADFVGKSYLFVDNILATIQKAKLKPLNGDTIFIKLHITDAIPLRLIGTRIRAKIMLAANLIASSGDQQQAV